MEDMELKYGCNPHQKPARVFREAGGLPIKVRNGKPGYINLLDAFNGWQLVMELKRATGLPAATSFKHVSPAGAAVGLPVSDVLRKIYHVEGYPLSPLASAYARARGADRMSSFGDFIALSDPCDKETAALIAREVSDGIIAPGYGAEALEILKGKRKGAYTIIEIDPDYVPEQAERKTVFGVEFEQGRNDIVLGPELLERIPTANKTIPEESKRDLLIALITLKYTQSNSVCFVKDGQAIGIGAGQQSRIHCTRLAGDKADRWYLRQHPQVLALPFLPTLGRPDRDNVTDVYVSGDMDEICADGRWREYFTQMPEEFPASARKAWLLGLTDVALGSDAFFPFEDNIRRAVASGVRYIAQPGGSIRDGEVIGACDSFGVAMAFTGIRLFHH
jgi:phosphoribosylaminoimidazolecarboxamide formyltransferase/IMP cyclohydrolase/phosphoribosylaminoimidazolecarboxamide formyltransferase